MFCTLKEAAQTLHADEDQIRALLEQGVLREFRAGEHRMVRQTDVGALAVLCPSPATQPSSLPEQTPTRTSRPAVRTKRKVNRTPPRSGLRSATARPRTSRKPGTKDTGPQTRGRASRPVNRRLPAPVVIAPAVPARREPAPITETRPGESLSLRQWFWMGLVQDRPVAIALLTGLVLLLLSAVVAGVCFAAETL